MFKNQRRRLLPRQGVIKGGSRFKTHWMSLNKGIVRVSFLTENPKTASLKSTGPDAVAVRLPKPATNLLPILKPSPCEMWSNSVGREISGERPNATNSIPALPTGQMQLHFALT